MMRRRAFVARTVCASAGLLSARVLSAQQRPPAPAQGTTSNLFDMNQGAAKTVRRPAKLGASASMTPDERDALEGQIRCQCGCTLDVYICRTTDFACQVSPAMHRDIISLVEGGYSAQEILDAFVATYGERALMAPTRQGFNLVGYLAPFIVLSAGAVGLTMMLRRMRRRIDPARRDLVVPPPGTSATAAEYAKLQAAVRRDE